MNHPIDVVSDRALAQCFNTSVGQRYGVICVGGYEEPEYRPVGYLSNQEATASRLAELRYTKNYAASALHEIAHWCIAGARRRRSLDFGYRYLAPPRSARVQAQFFASELGVQALEALFAWLSGVRFVPSADNFDCTPDALDRFSRAIDDRVEWLLQAPNNTVNGNLNRVGWRRQPLEELFDLALSGPRIPKRAQDYLAALRAANLLRSELCTQLASVQHG